MPTHNPQDTKARLYALVDRLTEAELDLEAELVLQRLLQGTELSEAKKQDLLRRAAIADTEEKIGWDELLAYIKE